MDSTLHSFMAEWEQEAKATRAYLASVPLDKADWKPHAKSFSLGKLAAHVAEIPSWMRITLFQDELDFATSTYKTPELNNTEALLAFFDQNSADAVEVLKACPSETLEDMWTMRHGDMVFFSLPKGVCIRTWVFNHQYHHRAQLGVYLRMLDIPLPSVYGPTADAQG